MTAELTIPQDLLPKTKCRAFRGAFAKGVQARMDGKPKSANPYLDHRADYQNSATWSRAFRRYWAEGWDLAGDFA